MEQNITKDQHVTILIRIELKILSFKYLKKFKIYILNYEYMNIGIIQKERE